MDSSRTLRAPRNRTLLAFGSFVVLVLLIINITGWVLWHFTSRLLADLLDRQLTAIAGLVSKQIDGDALLSTADSGDGPQSASHRLADELAAHQAAFRLADLYVFDGENRILANASGDGAVGQVNAALVLDTDEILDAWMGKTVTSPVISRGANMLKTGYAPVHDRAGRVVAVLGVETDVRFFDTLALAKNGLLAATVLVLLCIAGLALSFRRLLSAQLLAEERYEETARLAMVGRMSAQICHEIRNPLSIISATTEFVVRRLHKLTVTDAQVHELIRSVVEEIDRLNGILTRFLETARAPVLERTPQSLETLLNSLLGLVRADLDKAGIGLRTELEQARVQVNVDSSGLRQVFLNAILNARDAMAIAPRKELALVVVRLGSHRVEIRIDDTGPGVPDDVMEYVFEPFVTSKAVGTGLGLFVARRIIHQHDGEVRLENLPGGGTRFVVELPVMSVE